MREIIAVCRSEKRARDRVARVLDRYFWRIGDRTWRGKATNACLDRVAKELRKRATRNTAVVVHEIRSSTESRRPIIRIGTGRAFSEDGLVPVATHPAQFRSTTVVSQSKQTSRAVVAIAALFHDLGKASVLFQDKLRCVLKGRKPEADAVRHEFFSAIVWDRLFGKILNEELIEAMQSITSEQIDNACSEVIMDIMELLNAPKDLCFDFLSNDRSFSRTIGLLILTHHRLPGAEKNHTDLTPDQHLCCKGDLASKDLSIKSGTPFWHEEWWISAIKAEATRMAADVSLASADIGLRAALMFADHFGSSKKKKSDKIPDHLANTIKINDKTFPADSLSCHIRRVYRYSRFAHEMFFTLRDRYPALDEDALPRDVALPQQSKDARFVWQAKAARKARELCNKKEGGFFAAILAGTGSGKTRAAPTILANAAMGDVRLERRYFRMNLGLGMRVLATQSAQDYVNDLGFAARDVVRMVGEPPLEFDESISEIDDGSESLVNLPDWLRVEHPETRIPPDGDPAEANWLPSLSLNTDRGLPAFLSQILEVHKDNTAGGSKSKRRLLETPVMVGTLDHLMGVAAPVNSRFLFPALRMMTSDLILDEIDQYSGEDLAAIGRLVFQAGAAGRRVVIMSATLTSDIAEAFYSAYEKGWQDHAKATGTDPHVNLLITGDAPNSLHTNAGGDDISTLLKECQDALLKGIAQAPALRRGEILPSRDSWEDLMNQVDEGISRLHDETAVTLEGFRISAGLVRMTRISHASAMAVQLPSGELDRPGQLDKRLRLLVCLHAQMPRLHRQYIENRLKRALNRKEQQSDCGSEANFYDMCEEMKVFDRARNVGARDVEIVLVTTPIIETGNDLDFDWAIVDPISTRAIVQTAGRVRRHRPACGQGKNILILGRSPIVMDPTSEGKLQRPGVETRCDGETLVPFTDPLRKYEGRYFKDLAGDVCFEVITAAPILSKEHDYPLREAEAGIRHKMLFTDDKKPLGKYLSQPNVRWNSRMTRTRKFRRSDTKDIYYTRIGENLDQADWRVNLTLSLRDITWREPEKLDFPKISVEPLFDNLTSLGWVALSKERAEMTEDDLKNLFHVTIPIYENKNEGEPQLTYTEFTGFTRGTKNDLFEPFGKKFKKQNVNGGL